MRLRILGCHGGESPTHRNTCFLVDGNVLIEAGALTRGLTLVEQAQVDHVLLSHAHLDHVHDLAFLADNVLGKHKGPVEVHASAGTIDALRTHFFSGPLWPDFTRIPSPDHPTLRLNAVPPRQPIPIGALEARFVPVSHSVECHGIILSSKHAALAYSGDTGPTDEFWRVVNDTPHLRAIIVEVSFPNAMENIAKMSGHLTPAMLATELDKLRPDLQARIMISHIKPGLQAEVGVELEALGDPRLVQLRLMDDFEL